VLTRVERTEYSRATTIVYTHEYPLTLVGIGQMSRLKYGKYFHGLIISKYKCGRQSSRPSIQTVSGITGLEKRLVN